MAGRGLLDFVAWFGPDRVREQCLENCSVDGEAVVLELDGEQCGHRLRQRGEEGKRGGARGVASVGQVTYASLLNRLKLECDLGPAAGVVEVVGPGAAQPLPAELSVGAQCVVGLAVDVEQRQLPVGVGRLGQVVTRGPHGSRIVAREAVEEAPDSAEVPAGARPEAGIDQLCRGLARSPPHPPRRECVELGDDGDGIGRLDRVAAAIPGQGKANAGKECESQGCARTEPGERVSVSHRSPRLISMKGSCARLYATKDPFIAWSVLGVVVVEAG